MRVLQCQIAPVAAADLRNWQEWKEHRAKTRVRGWTGTGTSQEERADVCKATQNKATACAETSAASEDGGGGGEGSRGFGEIATALNLAPPLWSHRFFSVAVIDLKSSSASKYYF